MITTDRLTRETEEGIVRGTRDDLHTLVWKGIPYARAPVGERRWKAPMKMEKWEGIRDTVAFGDISPQSRILKIVGSEDCLYLNIWRPDSDEEGLPVVVEIHGGGNTVGTSGFPLYYGTYLAGKGKVIFVSLNYRLGIFGWFAHPALQTGDPLTDSGNFGTLDIISALQWIRENIAHFGGNPDNVTLCGESAGGSNVLSLLLSPLAKGLFHKAEVRSALTIGGAKEQGEIDANDLIERLLVLDGTYQDKRSARLAREKMDKRKVRDYLFSKSHKELLYPFQKSIVFGMYRWKAVFSDGTVIPLGGMEEFKKETYPNKVPLIIGSNKNEMKLFIGLVPLLHKARSLFVPVARYTSLIWKVRGVDEIARSITALENGPNVFAYEFAWGSTRDDGLAAHSSGSSYILGAHHGSEIPFFLGNPKESIDSYLRMSLTNPGNLPGKLDLMEAILSYKMNFIRTGDPGRGLHGDLVRWEKWSNEHEGPKCIILDATAAQKDIRMATREISLPALKKQIDGLPRFQNYLVSKLTPNYRGKITGPENETGRR